MILPIEDIMEINREKAKNKKKTVMMTHQNSNEAKSRRSSQGNVSFAGAALSEDLSPKS